MALFIYLDICFQISHIINTHTHTHTHTHTRARARARALVPIVCAIGPFEKFDLVPLDVPIDLSSTCITYSEKHKAPALAIYDNTVKAASTRTTTLFRLCSHFVFL